ncbi:MAG TPA: hypothetical protein VLI55_06675 [Bryobacteraceae bacterium]|nr:hypothetical protein [Bryobacteraceae bacterium]
MDEELVATLTLGDLKADVYSLSIPGEFKVIYRAGGGRILEESPLNGISTYKQREPEIMARLKQLAEGAKPLQRRNLSNPGDEY